MNDLIRLQSEHGEQLNEITQHPAFSAAMSFLNLQKIATIANLTDDEIEKNGKLILADLRGHLRHESDLFTLATKPNLEFGSIGPETYPDPLSEIDPPPIDNSEPEQEASPKPPRKRKK